MVDSIRKLLLIVVFLSGNFTLLMAQNTGFSQNINQGLIRIADQGQLADTLNLWGDVRNSGKYLVPRGTNLTDLISYAHGPAGTTGGEAWSKVKVDVFVSHYSQLNNKYNSKEFNLRLNEPLPQEMRNYPLQNGDVITVKAKKKPTFRDYFTIIAPILSLGLSAFLVVDRVNN